MKGKDLTKKDLQKIGNLSIYDGETLSKVKKDIDLICELDKQLVENKKVIAENHKKMAEAVNYDYERYLRVLQLI